MNRIQYIFKHFKSFRFLVVTVLLATVAYTITSLLSSLVFSFVIDHVIDSLPITNPFLIPIAKLLGGIDFLKENLWVVALFLLSLYLLHSLLMFYRYNGQALYTEGLCRNIRNDLYNHIQLLPYEFHVKAKTGDLVQRCTSDVDIIRRFFSGQFAEIVAILSSAIVALIILFSINARLAIISGITLPIIFFYSYRFFCKIQKQFLASDEKEGELTTNIQESLSGVRVIKAFNRERYELDRFLKISSEYKDVTYKMIISLGIYWSSSYFICLLGILLIVVMGIFAVRAGDITTGNFLVFITYQSTILYQIRQLGRILSDFGKLTVSVGRLVEIINQKPEDLHEGICPSLDGDIVFKDVSFQYNDDKRQILNHVNLTIKQGETLAIIGPTGSGKSSLVQLLARLYEVTEGAIEIAGTDIRLMQKAYLRENIGIVLQEPFLFSKSILDNLKVVNPRLEKSELIHATKIASVHDVIEEFEQGYQTLVGEKGVTLSGGQKQRIAIARTLVKDSKILIFDDSLSAVDTETDAAIRRALNSLDSSATKIIITQRVASAKDADHIIVLEEGMITEEGTHAELLALNGLYKRVSEIQNEVKGGILDVE